MQRLKDAQSRDMFSDCSHLFTTSFSDIFQKGVPSMVFSCRMFPGIFMDLLGSDAVRMIAGSRARTCFTCHWLNSTRQGMSLAFIACHLDVT